MVVTCLEVQDTFDLDSHHNYVGVLSGSSLLESYCLEAHCGSKVLPLTIRAIMFVGSDIASLGEDEWEPTKIRALGPGGPGYLSRGQKGYTKDGSRVLHIKASMEALGEDLLGGPGTCNWEFP